MSTIMIACGGTGGHLAPGIAVAQVLEKRGHDCLLLVSQKSVDSALTSAYKNLRFLPMPGRGFAGGLVSRIKASLVLLYGFFMAWRLLRRESPVVVFLFGGFLSAGPGLASRLLGIPVALHEANCAPGKATRLLARFAGRIYMPNDQNLKGIPEERIRHLGYPVRREIQKLAVDSARANLGLSVSGRLLVIIGGSQGASALNDWAEDNFEDLAELGISLYCVCGLKQAEAMERSYTNRKGMVCHFTRVQFSDRMGEVISAADLVVSRAGAGSIAELTVCRRPSILVPYPYAADNHQAANAEAHTREGAGLLLSQETLAGLTERVRELIFNDSELERMRNALSELDQFNSAEGIADDLLSLAGAKGERREGGSDAV